MSSAIEGDGIQSRIARGTKVSGKVHFGALALIEGEVEGEITGNEITIAEGAMVRARVMVDRMTVAGSLTGEIVSHERVELLATARVQCNIHTPKLVLHEGAQFDGDCKMPRERMAA